MKPIYGLYSVEMENEDITVCAQDHTAVNSKSKAKLKPWSPCLVMPVFANGFPIKLLQLQKVSVNQASKSLVLRKLNFKAAERRKPTGMMEKTGRTQMEMKQYHSQCRQVHEAGLLKGSVRARDYIALAGALLTLA